MYLIAIAWAYVALMMAAAEATSPQGSLLGAAITLLLYILGTPGRRRRQRASALTAEADAGSHAPAGPAQGLAPEREEA